MSPIFIQTHLIIDQAIKGALALLLFYIAWLCIKRITITAEKRALRFEVFKQNPGLFVSIQGILRYALIMTAGTYLATLFNILLTKKIFHALLVMLIAGPVKTFLIIALKYAETNISKKTATRVDDIDIGLRATKIRTTDNIVIVIPNNEIMTRDIVNYTLINARIRVRINVGVAYTTDIQKASDVLVNLAKTVAWVSAVPKPKVVVRGFGDSSVNLQLRVWIDDARQRMNTISAISDKIKRAFDEAGIEIPFPKRDITIVNANQQSPATQ